jgi:hypothetical protein
VKDTRILMMLTAAFLGGILGGLISELTFTSRAVQAQKANSVNAEEFLLVDPAGKARAGLGLDANGEVGLVLTSKDGKRTLTLSPDERMVVKLVERGGRVLWAVP